MHLVIVALPLLFPFLLLTVLNLRSFQDDTVPLAAPPSGFVSKLFAYADRKKTLDELLLTEGTTFGPVVVALGNPTDAVPLRPLIRRRPSFSAGLDRDAGDCDEPRWPPARARCRRSGRHQHARPAERKPRGCA